MQSLLQHIPKFEKGESWLASSAQWLVWQALAAALILATATYFVGNPKGISADKVQLLLALMTYFLALVVSLPFAKLSSGLFSGLIIAFTLGTVAAIYVLLTVAGLPISPQFLAAFAIVLLAFLVGSYSTTKVKAVLIALALAAIAALAAFSRFTPDSPTTGVRDVDTALHGIQIRTYFGLIPKPSADGGAFAVQGNNLLLATGEGKFYWLTRKQDELAAQLLEFPSPTRREAYLKNFSDPTLAPRLRLTDAIFSDEAEPQTLFVAHQSWNAAGKCYTMRVSSIGLVWSKSGIPTPATAWKRLFDARPCVKAEGVYDDSETGGRLAWSKDGLLLLTLGHLGFAGLGGTPAYAQLDGNDYGKILSIDPSTGDATIVSKGHRNPQGLVVRRDGEIWSAEHGPQGGDEINHIVAGANYGWPLVTYGTKYGTDNWPLNPEGRNHGEYEEPAIAFVPSIAISALIEVGGPEFPKWNGDLLASSLRTEAIFRVRLSENRVIYVESTSVGHRVRDLIQTADGRIYIWSDASSVILEIRRRDSQSAVTRHCAGCHEAKFGAAAAPRLEGIIGRKIASVPDYPYSDALKGKQGRWTREELDRFLQDPNAYAPGTSMKVFGMEDRDRKEVLDELSLGTR